MHWFCKPFPALRTHHLHLVPVTSRLWVERLAEQYRTDREAYSDAKGPFIERVLANAGVRA